MKRDALSKVATLGFGATRKILEKLKANGIEVSRNADTFGKFFTSDNQITALKRIDIPRKKNRLARALGIKPRDYLQNGAAWSDEFKKI